MLIKVIALLFVVAVIFAECLIAFLFIGGSGSAQQVGAAEDAAADQADSPNDSAGSPRGGKGVGAEADASPFRGAERSKAAHAKEGGAKAESGKQGQGDKKGAHGSKSGAGHTSSQGDSPSDLVEIDLERFVVTAYQPNSSTIVRVDFHLFGMVAAKDCEEFQRLMEIHQHRFREQVLVIVRRAEPADLADPGLGLIKRQILEKTNALLGKPLVQAVVVSDFSYLEQ